MGRVLTLLVVLLALAAPVTASAAKPTPRARIVAALRANYLTMRLDGTFRYGFFAPSARAYWNRGGMVLLWQFRTVARARAAAHRISADGSRIGGTQVNWKGTPHWFRHGRVIAMYLGGNQWMLGVLERVLGPAFAGG